MTSIQLNAIHSTNPWIPRRLRKARSHCQLELHNLEYIFILVVHRRWKPMAHRIWGEASRWESTGFQRHSQVKVIPEGTYKVQGGKSGKWTQQNGKTWGLADSYSLTQECRKIKTGQQYGHTVGMLIMHNVGGTITHALWALCIMSIPFPAKLALWDCLSLPKFYVLWPYRL